MSQSFLASMLDLRLDPMTPAVDWGDVAARLAAAVAIGIALGFNRSESGKAAGMRTTALVTLAAALAMIEANVLIGTTGREPQAFAAIDPMRLPLGVLTGVGFIGAGAILRRDGLIVGVATAATLWLATVAGLCAGAGRLGLAFVGVAAGLVAQWLVKWAEDATPRLHEARLAVAVSGAGPGEPELRRLLAEAGFTVVASALAVERERRTYRYDLIMPARARVEATPEAVERLARVHGVERLEWRRGGLAPDA